MVSTGEATFSSSNSAGPRRVPSSAVRSSYHGLQITSVWMEKAGTQELLLSHGGTKVRASRWILPWL